MKVEPLRRMGMSESDTKIYLSLLKLGKSNVSQLAEESGVHRTNIYTILDKLKEMGLVSYFHEDNRMKFRASDPKNLLNYLKENKEAIQDLIPDLQKIHDSVSEKVGVEILRGEKGMKSAMNDIVRTGKGVIGFGIAGQLREYMPIFAKQWIRDMKKYKIKNRYIYVEGSEFIHPQWNVRTLPREFSTHVSTQIYGNKILIAIWEPTKLAIVIKSQKVADNYRRHFELLWNIAKIPKAQILKIFTKY